MSENNLDDYFERRIHLLVAEHKNNTFLCYIKFEYFSSKDILFLDEKYCVVHLEIKFKYDIDYNNTIERIVSSDLKLIFDFKNNEIYLDNMNIIFYNIIIKNIKIKSYLISIIKYNNIKYRLEYPEDIKNDIYMYSKFKKAIKMLLEEKV